MIFRDVTVLVSTFEKLRDRAAEALRPRRPAQRHFDAFPQLYVANQEVERLQKALAGVRDAHEKAEVEVDRLHAYVAEMQPKLGKQQDEIERLTRERDQLFRSCEELAKRVVDAEEKLQRFRDRETKLDDVLHNLHVLRARLPNETQRMIETVRDFKVTP